MFPLSVIIPSYNRASVVDHTLQSLTQQSVTNFQTIVVDHGSTDNTEEVCKKYQNSLHLSYYKISRADDKFVAAVPRSFGVDHAESQFIAFIDTGMVLPPQYVESHVAFHRLHKNYVGIGMQHGADLQYRDNKQDFSTFLSNNTEQSRLNSETGSKDRAVTNPSSKRDLIDALYQTLETLNAGALSRANIDQAYQALTKVGLLDRRKSIDLEKTNLPWVHGWTANLSMPREAYLAVGGFNLELRGWGFEDVDLSYRLSKHGLKFAIVEGGWGIELPQERKPMGERFATLQKNMFQCYAKSCSLALETLALRQVLLQKAAAIYRSLPTTKANGIPYVPGQMHDELLQQSENIFNYLTSLGHASATLPQVSDEIQEYVTHPTLLVGGTTCDAQKYDFVALGNENILSTPSTWSCCAILIPVSDQSLGTVVVSDIWKKLDWFIDYPFGISSMSVLEVLISEIKRAAKEAIFVHSSSVSGISVETLEDLCHKYDLSYKVALVDQQQGNSSANVLSVEKA
jgi:glycosyltransferase involved in cell wall biosynthesis